MAALRSSDDTVSSAEVDGLARKLQAEEVGGALRIGDCALRDPDSRVAAVTIDQMFHVLQRAAQTNPKLKATDWAHPVPADPEDWEINPEALLRVRTNIAAIAAHTDPGSDPEPGDRQDARSTSRRRQGPRGDRPATPTTTSKSRPTRTSTANPPATMVGQKPVSAWWPGDPGPAGVGDRDRTHPNNPGRARRCGFCERPGRCWSSP